MRRLTTAGVAFAARAFAAEEISEGSTKGRRTLRPAEAPHGWTRFRVTSTVGTAAIALLLLFLFIMIIFVVHTKAKPGRDAV
jgi:hypothetical protein